MAMRNGPGGQGRRAEEASPAMWGWRGGALLAAVVLGLFYAVWKGQFAAPPGYLFATPSVAQEAGYCLSVAQDVIPGGAPIGSYVEEAAQFWLGRLRAARDAPMGQTLGAARARLSADIQKSGLSAQDWLQRAMGLCSNRAVMYGMRFQTLGR